MASTSTPVPKLELLLPKYVHSNDALYLEILSAISVEELTVHGTLELTVSCLLPNGNPMQAYTSQVLVMILFGVMMSEDRVSAQARREEVMAALQELPGKLKRFVVDFLD